MALSDLVHSTVSTDGAALKQAGFGIQLLVDYHTKFAERARYYTELSGMTTDGFVAGDPLYKMAQEAFSQDPRPEKVLVGRLALPYTQIVKWIPTITTSGYVQTITIEIAGEILTATYTNGGSETVALIIDNMLIAIAALDDFDSFLTLSDQTTYLRITSTAGKRVYYSNWSGKYEDVTTNPGIATDLDAIKLENEDWYGANHALSAKAIQQPMAAWIEANTLLYTFENADWQNADSGSSTDIFFLLEGLSYARSGGYPRKHSDGDHLDVGAMAERFVHDPGVGPGAGGTWFGKTVKGALADDWTPTEKANLRAKNANVYISTAGRSHTLDGKSASGEYLDVVRFLDWNNARIEEAIATSELDAERVPFTDQGISMIGKDVQSILDIGVQAGGWSSDPYPTVTVPKAKDISKADKSARRLRGIKWTATLAGAIQLSDVDGTAL